MLFGYPLALIYSHITLGLINGAFYAVLSLGLAIIFGILGIINFVHGALYMMGAVFAWMLLATFGFGYWLALLVSPLIVGILAIALERIFISRLYAQDQIYAFILTFGLALMIESLFSNFMGSTGLTYPLPPQLTGAVNLGFMFVPRYRIWIVIASAVACAAAWLLIDETKLGSKLRAAAENGPIVQALGVNVPLMRTLTYGAGGALAAFAGVLAAPIYSVSPHMGTNIVIVVFAIVVIGGLGSIKGSILASLGLGVLEGLAKLFVPNASAVVIFVVMAVVLLYRGRSLT